jgi:curli biogenesis system outer membrane secretion channel CsgG
MKRVSSLVLGGALLFALLAAPVLTLAAPNARGEKPGIAVLQFKSRAENQRWNNGVAEAAQDAFGIELVKINFRVVRREEFEARMRGENLPLSGDVNPRTARQIGKLLNVKYLITGSVTEFGPIDQGDFGLSGKRNFKAALNARLIDTSTGGVVWADEASEMAPRGEAGVDDSGMFEKTMKPCIQKLTASLFALVREEAGL